MNGAAAHLINAGDVVDIMAFRWAGGRADPVLIEVDGGNKFARYADLENL
jgi:aspartate 1-decarboxylase